MVAVKIADLKNNLSRHLERVRHGAELTVLDRHTPVARIVPFTPEESRAIRPADRTKSKSEAAARIALLAQSGVIAPGDSRAVAEWARSHKPVTRPAGAASAVDLLLELRREPRR